MNKLFKGFALSVSMLTIIPFFKVHHFYKGINGYAVMFYPLVGFLVGLFLYFLHSILSLHLAPLHLGIIIFFLMVLLTGALHLDGFSDTIDGLFVPKEKALEVMKDPHAGGMGVIFSISFLILKASSLAVFDAFYLLPIIMMLSRFNAVVAIYFYPYISKGMGLLAKEELKGWQFVLTMLCVVFLTIPHILVFAISLLVIFFIKLFFIKRYGGFSGDMYGFSIEVTELILLNAILLGAGI